MAFGCSAGRVRRSSCGFARLSARLLELHQFLLQSPTEVTFTPGQWAEHTLRFASHLSEVVNERDDSPGAIVLRHGLMASRIACVLTALRKGECAWAMPEYACSDEDFHTAMLMTDVLLEHSLLLSTCMQKSESKPKPLKPYFRLRPVLQVLSGTFTLLKWWIRLWRWGFLKPLPNGFSGRRSSLNSL